MTAVVRDPWGPHLIYTKDEVDALLRGASGILAHGTVALFDGVGTLLPGFSGISSFEVLVPNQRFRVKLATPTIPIPDNLIGLLMPTVFFVQADGEVLKRQIRAYSFGDPGFDIEIQDLAGTPSPGGLLLIFVGVFRAPQTEVE